MNAEHAAAEQIFLQACRGLLEQRDQALDGDETCTFHDPVSGNMCAIGLVMDNPKESINCRNWEDQPEEAISKQKLRALNFRLNDGFGEMLGDALQHVHDQREVDQWFPELQIIARDFEFDYLSIIAEFGPDEFSIQSLSTKDK